MIESVVNIFVQLGVDVTIWYQFAIFTILYPLLTYLFFNRLQFVIEHREGRTTKLESGANKKFENAERLSKEFDEKVKVATNEAQSFLKAEKSKAASSAEADYRSKEKEILSVVDAEVASYRKEIESKKEAIIGQAVSLSDNLVEKLT